VNIWNSLPNSVVDTEHTYSPPPLAPPPRWHVKKNTATDRVTNYCHRNNTIYKCATGAYPLGDFYQIFIICKTLHVRTSNKIWADSIKGFHSFGLGFQFRDVHVTPNFQHLLAAKLCIGSKHVLEVQAR